MRPGSLPDSGRGAAAIGRWQCSPSSGLAEGQTAPDASLPSSGYLVRQHPNVTQSDDWPEKHESPRGIHIIRVIESKH
ncbi:hypothetical protein Anapl_02263 [Anas platyrhynchos]|uniref:Uncharacterized protein n=1 Tax=Anas platyrhynchos TaxID=8839 RepID=R0LSR1_ANAPL|nr:hypothetical protein Anapl_02263 [Anas platyrhynchos]